MAITQKHIKKSIRSEKIMISKLLGQFKYLLANEHFKEVFKGSVVTFGIKIITLLIGFFTTWFISKWYGAGGLGQVVLLNSVVGMIMIFTVMGMSDSLVRLVPEHIAKYSFYSAFLAYKKILLFVGIISLVVAIVYNLFFVQITEHIFHKSNLDWLFVLVAPLIFLRSIQSINISMIQAMKQVNVMAFFQLIQPMLFTLFIILGTFFYFDKTVPVYAQVIVDVCLFCLSLVTLYFVIKKNHIIKKFRIIRYSELLSLSLPMMISGVFTSIVFQTDTLMIGMMKTDVDVGIYSVAMKLASLASFILLSVNTFAAPKFSELYHMGKREDLEFVAQGFSKLLFILTLALSIFMIIFGQWILSFFGEQFVAGYYALIFILVSWIFNAWSGPVSVMMNMIGLHKEVQHIYMIAAFVNVGLNVLLIPLFGITGSAVASMISGIITSTFSIIIVYKKEGFLILYVPNFIKKPMSTYIKAFRNK